MKKIAVVILLAFAVLSCDKSEDKIIYEKINGNDDDPDDSIPTDLTTSEMLEGIFTALLVSTDTAVSRLGRSDGFNQNDSFRISLPPEADVILENMSRLGPQGEVMVKDAMLKINRAAEDAASQATPYFSDAIEELNIYEPEEILNGADDAATQKLRYDKYIQIEKAFPTTLDASLNKRLMGISSAREAYQYVLNTYNNGSLNNLLYPKITENTLSEHSLELVLEALFYEIGAEEGRIRNDSVHQVNDILKKVFGE